MKFLERPYVVIPVLLIVAFALFFNVMSKSEKEKEKEQVAEAKQEQKADGGKEEKTEATQTAFNGEEIYKQTCIGCHGDAYQGGVGPKLTKLSDKYSAEDVAKILKEGKGQGMPSGLVSGQEKQMAEWLLTLK